MNQTTTLDRRQKNRKSVFKGAVLSCEDGNTFPCVVRDISSTGAQIQISSEANIPNKLTLYIDLDGIGVKGEVVWRSGDQIGFRFTSELEVSFQKNNIHKSNTFQQNSNQSIPILIADDDPDDRYLIGSAFKESTFKHPISFVENGVELLKYLRSEAPYEDRQLPGLILLDLNMPQLDGRNALVQIKSDSEFRRIPIVVLTTSTAEEDIQNSYDLGVSAYVSKPGSYDDMIELVEVLNQYWIKFASIPLTSKQNH